MQALRKHEEMGCPMTPTREQVIEWAKAAGLSFDDGWIFYTPKRQSLPEAEFGAFVAAMNAAYSAGRLKGLDEAKEVIRSKTHHPDDPNNCVWTAAYDHVAAEHAAAIDQLKEPTP